jgi:cell division protein FtsI/penicillin-binding protein 2
MDSSSTKKSSKNKVLSKKENIVLNQEQTEEDLKNKEESLRLLKIKIKKGTEAKESLDIAEKKIQSLSFEVELWKERYYSEIEKLSESIVGIKESNEEEIFNYKKKLSYLEKKLEKTEKPIKLKHFYLVLFLLILICFVKNSFLLIKKGLKRCYCNVSSFWYKKLEN